MRRKLSKRIVTGIVTACLLGSMLSGCTKDSKSSNSDDLKKEDEVSKTVESGNEGNDQKSETAETDPWKLAETSPDIPYPETVEYTVGVTVPNGVKYPAGSGDTSEDNAFTRLYKDQVNIQSINKYEATDGEDNNQKVTMAISSGDLPDVMMVSDYKTFRELVDNDMIADLTDAYNNCASDLMKEIYASNDNKSLDMATIDGKLYAIPTTRIADGPELLWLRGDWMDQLGLEAPKTVDDITNILQKFKDANLGKTESNVGLALMPAWNNNFLYGIYAGGYESNNLFTMNGACPKQWIADENGKAIYGSVQPEMKEGLKVLADWYGKGLIDQQFMVRTEDDIKALIGNGDCGACFGGWWFPYHGAAAYTLNPDAEWRAYAVPAGKDGKLTAFTNNPNQNYFVVRKGFEHPELLVKGKNASLKYNQSAEAFSDKRDVVKDFCETVVGQYAVDPLGGFDYFDAAIRSYEHISEALEGKRDEYDMIMFEHTLYGNCKAYKDAVDKGEKPSTESWLDYNCRIVSGKVFAETEMNYIDPVFFGQTETMGLKWATLTKMEEEAVMKIITGEESLDYFDTFVSDWKTAGGDQITEEVNEEIAK